MLQILPRVVALGEILWDIFPQGPRLGGAPANFACHVAALGGDARLVSGLGNDDLGKEAAQLLKQHRVNIDLVLRTSAFPTGTVQVNVDEQGHPSYEFGTDQAWDHLEWTDQLAQLAHHLDAVCFGTLGQRAEQSQLTIQRFVAATESSALRILDINLRPPFYEDAVIDQSLNLANVLKLNDDELDTLSPMYDLHGTPTDKLRQLALRFDLQLVAMTRGRRGAILMRGGEISDHAGLDVDVDDTVGAGDSFTAALTMGLLSKATLPKINQHACEIAAFVCSQPGATPKLPEELTRTF